MKDEVREDIINEFFGLKAKMYSLVMLEDKEIKKTKSCQKCCWQHKILKICECVAL